MALKTSRTGDSLTIFFEDRIDTSNATALEEEVTALLPGVKELIFDFEKLNYVSSAGLRMILIVEKIMKKQGSLLIKKVPSQIMDIFTMTGFDQFLKSE